jgi:hypothetical protein
MSLCWQIGFVIGQNKTPKVVSCLQTCPALEGCGAFGFYGIVMLLLSVNVLAGWVRQSKPQTPKVVSYLQRFHAEAWRPWVFGIVMADWFCPWVEQTLNPKGCVWCNDAKV